MLTDQALFWHSALIPVMPPTGIDQAHILPVQFCNLRHLVGRQREIIYIIVRADVFGLG